jgi:hypothetical protein
VPITSVIVPPFADVLDDVDDCAGAVPDDEDDDVDFELPQAPSATIEARARTTENTDLVFFLISLLLRGCLRVEIYSTHERPGRRCRPS